MRSDRISDRPLGRRGEVVAEGELLLDGAVRGLDRFRIGYPGERFLRNREVNPEFRKLLAAVLCDVVVDVDDQVFEEFHGIVMVRKRDLHVKRRGLVEVPDGVMLLGAKDGAELEDRLEPGGHHHLFIKLGALVQECLLLKVGDREEFGAALGGGGDDLRGCNIDAAPGGEEHGRGAGHRRADEEDGADTRLPRVQEPGVKPGVEFGRHFLGDVERERALRGADDLELLGDDLAPAGGLLDCFDPAPDPDHGLSRDVPGCFKDLRRDLLLRDGHLDDAGPVADQEKRKSSEIADLVHPADDLGRFSLWGYGPYW